MLVDALGNEATIYRQLLEVITLGNPVPPFIGTPFMFRVSLYEKCASQIGQLGPEEAAGLVRFHGFIDGLKDEGRTLFSDAKPAPLRMKTLSWLLDEHLPSGMGQAKELQRNLAAAVARKWRPWLH
jgi:hypothetical protein